MNDVVSFGLWYKERDRKEGRVFIERMLQARARVIGGRVGIWVHAT